MFLEICLKYITVSYSYSRHESSFQGSHLPPSVSKGGPSSQQPASVLGAAGTLHTCKTVALYVPGPPGSSGRLIFNKASKPTKPDHLIKGGSHKLCIIELSSTVIGKIGCTSPKFPIASGDANHFQLPRCKASDKYMPRASTIKKLLICHFFTLAYEIYLYRQLKKTKRKPVWGNSNSML